MGRSSCRAHHDVASLADAKERCWLCGSKQHRKSDCPTKSLDTPKRESPGGDSGGGSYGGGGEKAAGKGNKGGKGGGGKLQKVMPEVPPLPGRQGETAETAASTGGATGGGAKETATTSMTSSTATPNAEVAQLLKSLSIQGPTLKALMAQIGDASGMTLIDSGATHTPYEERWTWRSGSHGATTDFLRCGQVLCITASLLVRGSLVWT